MLAPHPPPGGDVVTALGENFESQRARDRRRLDEPHGDAIAEAVGLATARANERMAVLVIAEVVGADGPRRHESVSAGVVQFDEQSGAGSSRNVTRKRCAD